MHNTKKEKRGKQVLINQLETEREGNTQKIKKREVNNTKNAHKATLE